MEQVYAYGTLGLIVGYFALELIRRRFDPFAPVWVFLFGYLHVYVIQALSNREWAIDVRGLELVTAANAQALWALVVFLVMYQCGLGRALARRYPSPPVRWSAPTVGVISPLLVVWGLVCGGIIAGNRGVDSNDISAEEQLFRSFAFVLLVAGIVLIVTGRQSATPRPAYLVAGIAVSALYVLVWTFNGKRSHALMGVMEATCAFYITRGKRPSWAILLTLAFIGASVVALAITWREQKGHEQSFSGFVEFASEFNVSSILVSLNMKDREVESPKPVSHETEEYGGYLLMLDTVPEKAEYDYGANYLRIFSTFIPRIIWPSKPLFGREQWVNAWIAGSELKRDSRFTGPAIGILGATQLNGGAWGTAIVLACAGLLLRSFYEYFLLHADVPWIQAWWSTFFLNAWFMVVGDDPLTWFYYNWGISGLPVLLVFWFANSMGAPAAAHRMAPAA